MEVLQYITQQCDLLTDTAGSVINSTGVSIALSLATIMMVWFGIQEAIASARGGPGFNVEDFLNFVMLFAFVYTLVVYYDTDIPRLGFSFRSFIKDGTNELVKDIGYDTNNNIQDAVDAVLAKQGPVITILTSPYWILMLAILQMTLSGLSALCTVILAYGAIGAAVVGVLGPVMIPWLMVPKLDFLFWGWFKAYLAFSFYKVVTAAVLGVMSTVFTHYVVNKLDFTQPKLLTKDFSIILTLVFVCLFIIVKIPAMVTTIFSGSTGGHDGGTGVIRGFIGKIS